MGIGWGRIRPMRAQRRHHRERLKRARRVYWGRERRLTERQLGIAVNTPKPCGCMVCRNPRLYLGVGTRQEERERSLDRTLRWRDRVGNIAQGFASLFDVFGEPAEYRYPERGDRSIDADRLAEDAHRSMG